MARPVSTGLRQDQSFTPNAPTTVGLATRMYPKGSTIAGSGRTPSFASPTGSSLGGLAILPYTPTPTPTPTTQPVTPPPRQNFPPPNLPPSPNTTVPSRAPVDLPQIRSPSVIKLELPSTLGGGGIWRGAQIPWNPNASSLRGMVGGVDVESAAFNVARGFPVSLAGMSTFMADEIQQRAIQMKQQGYTSPAGESVTPMGQSGMPSVSSYYHPEMARRVSGEVSGGGTPVPMSGGPGQVPGFGSLEDFFQANPLARLQYNSAADQIARSYTEAGRQADAYFSREGRYGSPAHVAEQRKVERDRAAALLSTQGQVIKDFADQQVTPSQSLQAQLEREKMALDERMGLTELKSREAQVATQARASEDAASMGLLEAWMAQDAQNQRAMLQAKTQLAVAQETTFRGTTTTRMNVDQRDLAARIKVQTANSQLAGKMAQAADSLQLKADIANQVDAREIQELAAKITGGLNEIESKDRQRALVQKYQDAMVQQGYDKMEQQRVTQYVQFGMQQALNEQQAGYREAQSLLQGTLASQLQGQRDSEAMSRLIYSVAGQQLRSREASKQASLRSLLPTATKGMVDWVGANNVSMGTPEGRAQAKNYMEGLLESSLGAMGSQWED